MILLKLCFWYYFEILVNAFFCLNAFHDIRKLKENIGQINGQMAICNSQEKSTVVKRLIL